MAMVSTDKSQSKEKSLLKAVTKVAGNSLFILLLIVLTFMTIFMIQSKLNSDKTSFKGYRSYIVLSGSMNPAFDTGSVVFIKSIQPKDIQPGDIITFKTTGTSKTTTTHRIMEVHHDQGLHFTTKGDANDVIDPVKLLPEQVIGKVRFAVPYLGYLLHFASTRLGTYLLVILPLTFIIILEVIKIIKQGKGKKKQATEVIGKVQSESISQVQTMQVDREEVNVKKENSIKEGISRIFTKAAVRVPDEPVLDEPVVEQQPVENNLIPDESENPDVVQIDMEERKNLMNTLQKLNLEIEQKLSSIRSLDKTLMDAPVKKNDATSIVTEIVTKAQLHWTGKVYNYEIQIKQLEQDLKNVLDEKKQEEQKLDHSVAMLKQELTERTNAIRQNKEV